MGYTHYWDHMQISQATFKKIVHDFKIVHENYFPDLLCREFDNPKSKPIINNAEVFFNGKGEDGHETFSFSHKKSHNFCKTARKPYDIAVTCFLVISKHHLRNNISVASDGEINDWLNAMRKCKESLGYGSDFILDND